MKKNWLFFIAAIAVLTTVVGCGKPRVTGVQQLYPAPEGLEPPIGTDGAVANHPIFIYWSQTRSERGYIQNSRLAVVPPSEFTHFLTAFNETLRYGYNPLYYRLKKQSNSFIKWEQIDAADFDPAKSSFYDAVLGGDFEKGGPLKMLYQEGLVKADDLTVVVSDLEEQNLNNTALAGAIRNGLLVSPRNAAAIIALKLPFNGENYKPDPNNYNNMISQMILGEKPLYLIVTGLKSAVDGFVKNYTAIAGREGVQSRIVRTVQADDIKPLGAVDAISLPSASLSDQTRIDRNNKKILSDIWNIRNGATGVPGKIWNLQDETISMVNYFGVPDGNGGMSPIKEMLDLQLFRYKTIGGNAKNGHRLWQLNIAFALPAGSDIAQLETSVENYRYLTDAPESSVDDPKDGDKKKKSAKKTPKQSVPGVWTDAGAAALSNDIEVSMKPSALDSDKTVFYVVPRDKKRGALESPIVCFDAVATLKRQTIVSIPDWAAEFDDDDKGGATEGKTWNFKAFVGLILGLEADGQPKTLETRDELFRTPVVLFNMPTRNKK
ncbi:MAG: hypothetical protein LBE74_10105 [Treponema sp.]|jgi:hypothetical protein|nr:hypothetical protein [Treponema sp.]